MSITCTVRMNPRSGFALALAFPLLLIGCTSLAPPSSGTLKCGSQPHPCPDGFECSSVTNTCWPRGKGPDGSSGDTTRATDTTTSDASGFDLSKGDGLIGLPEVGAGADGGPDAPVIQPDGSFPDLAPQDRFTPSDLSPTVEVAPAVDQAQATDVIAGVCASAANGTPCGTGMVCNGSQCVQCVAGDSCPVATSCHKGVWSCSTGTRTCVDNGSAEDGTACAGGNVCAKGICTTCVAGGSCPLPGNPCRSGLLTCAGGSPLCVDNGAKPDGTACDDANACSSGDKCVAGVCSPGTVKTCPASDQCHDVGTCNAGTGLCSNPAKTNGSVCNDGNACTQTDTCQAGSCVGANPVTCTALDQCHVVGTCNTSSGVCTNPNKDEGSGCNDGNQCTQTDRCQGGACVGSNPVTCRALDQCHVVGACNPGTGVCSDPNKGDGIGCEDGNLCTTNDSCQGGTCRSGAAKTCTASDDCHLPGTCDTSTGLCSNPNAPNGTGCLYAPDTGDTGTCCSGTCRYSGCY